MSNSTRPRLAAWALSVLAVAGTFLFPATPAVSQDFYAGKRLTILVNYDAGGPTDIEARLIGRHIGRHIPGQPVVIVQNMGGAGGIIGAKYLGEKAPRDGTVMGYFTAAAQHAVFAPEKFAVDFRASEFIAYMPNGRILFMRTAIKPGMTAAQDILKAEGVVAGGLSADSPKDIAMRIVLDMLGVPHKYVTGYNSSAQATLAFQRGELNVFSDSPSAYISKIEPTMVKAGEVLPVCFDPIYSAGTYVVPKQIKALTMPSCPDMIAKLKGGMPKGAMTDAYISLLSFAGTMYRTLTMPQGSPKEAVAALRTAMQRLNEDKEFLDEAQKVIGEAPDYIAGPDINEDARRLLAVSPEVKAFIADYARKGGSVR